MFETMNGDWALYRSLPKSRRVNLIATSRVLRMVRVADEHDADTRRKLREHNR